MALILESTVANSQRLSWQTVNFSFPAENGFSKGNFKAQFQVPTGEELKREMDDKTMSEMLDVYFVDAKGIKQSPSDKEDVPFDDDIKKAILNTPYLVKPLFKTFLETCNGGKQKN
ncbi:MAG: hypothetical protein VX100_07455 [Pseudomonadota bacterium]|nr:hypothetical protein [Pseudomonadota bacterium]